MTMALSYKIKRQNGIVISSENKKTVNICKNLLFEIYIYVNMHFCIQKLMLEFRFGIIVIKY